jgi:hypothetical protein
MEIIVPQKILHLIIVFYKTEFESCTIITPLAPLDREAFYGVLDVNGKNNLKYLQFLGYAK